MNRNFAMMQKNFDKIQENFKCLLLDPKPDQAVVDEEGQSNVQ